MSKLRSHAIGRVRRDQTSHTSVVDLEPMEVALMRLQVGERVLVHDGASLVDGEVAQDADGDWVVQARARLERNLVRVRRPQGATR